jgi:uncharacterized protein involved in outer membrane biogenesis
MNKLALLAITILLFAGAALWFLAPDALNQYIKNQIETIGSQTTEQAVKVNQVDFRLTKGQATISGLSIANPQKYQQKHAFTLGTIELDVDVNSLTKTPIVVEKFAIHDAKAFVELAKSGRANFQDILDAINKNLPTSSKSTEQETDKANEPKVRIDKLLLSGIGLTLDLRQLGLAQYQETLPSIDLGSVGGKAGLPASELGVEIGKKIMDSVWQQAKKVQKDKLAEKLKAQLDEKKAELQAKAAQKKAELKAKAEQKKTELKEKTNNKKEELKDKAKKKLGSFLDKIKD